MIKNNLSKTNIKKLKEVIRNLIRENKELRKELEAYKSFIIIKKS